jgi:hypothetical protein
VTVRDLRHRRLVLNQLGGCVEHRLVLVGISKVTYRHQRFVHGPSMSGAGLDRGRYLVTPMWTSGTLNAVGVIIGSQAS